MDGEWRVVTLAEASDEITVGHVGPMADEYVPDGVPFLRSLNIEPFTIQTEDLRYIKPEFHSRLRKSALKPGDVVIVRTGKPGACAVIPNWLTEANCSDLVIVRPSREVRPSFLCYVVNSVAQGHIGAHTVGAVQQHFNVGSARTLRFKIPSLAEQDRIIGLLDAVLEKIELNRRTAETLVAMARALFKSWFVDFDPVRARVENRPTGLPDQLAALFPDTFGVEGLPNGWGERTISDLFEISGGNTPRTENLSFWGGPHQWATPKDLSSLAAPVLLETGRQLTDAGLAQASSGLLPPGALLLSTRAPIGYMAFIARPTAINQGFAGIVRKQVSTVYAWGWCHENMNVIIGNAGGSTFPEISKSVLRQLPMLAPPMPVLDAFSLIADTLIERVIATTKGAQTLAKLRETLLPKLISGELRIADAEERIAAA